MKLLAVLFALLVFAPTDFRALAADPVKVPASMGACSKDEECEAVPLRCGCCQYGAVAKLSVTDYLKFADGHGCVDEPCNCKPLKLKPACVKSVCQLVQQKAKPRKSPKKKRKV